MRLTPLELEGSSAHCDQPGVLTMGTLLVARCWEREKAKWLHGQGTHTVPGRGAQGSAVQAGLAPRVRHLGQAGLGQTCRVLPSLIQPRRGQGAGFVPTRHGKAGRSLLDVNPV